MKRLTPALRAGFTILELVIAGALAAVVLSKAAVIVRATREAMSQETSAITIEDHAREVMDRMALNLMSCDRETLTPILTPDYTTGVTYQFSNGIENGAVVWGDPEEIGINAGDAAQLRWRTLPGQPGEQSAVWSRSVLPLFQGEEVNNVDDNGNGLIDEEGLSFSIDGPEVVIRLSLGRVVEGGELVERAIERVIVCRNNPGSP